MSGVISPLSGLGVVNPFFRVGFLSLFWWFSGFSYPILFGVCIFDNQKLHVYLIDLYLNDFFIFCFFINIFIISLSLLLFILLFFISVYLPTCFNLLTYLYLPTFFNLLTYVYLPIYVNLHIPTNIYNLFQPTVIYLPNSTNP